MSSRYYKETLLSNLAEIELDNLYVCYKNEPWYLILDETSSKKSKCIKYISRKVQQ